MAAPLRSRNNDSEDSSPMIPIAPERAPKSVTLRSLSLGLLLSAINIYWVTLIEVRYGTSDGTSLPLFITPIFFLFCLALGNLGLRKVAPKYGFTQGELLIIYFFLVMGTMLAGHDLLQNLFGSIAHAARNVTPENKWESLFFAFLPNFWLVNDPVAVKGFYQGNVNPYDPTMWGPFIQPLLWWALFICTLIGICLCASLLIRRAWNDNERLTFPLIQIPLALTENSGAKLFSSRLMWIGFSIAMALDLLNGFHELYPSLPSIPYLKLFNIGQFFTTRPMNVLSPVNISMYPFAIGLAYFVPLDLSFSCWFFFVARCIFRVSGTAAGWDQNGNQGFPYFEQQSSGAWIAWGLALAWTLAKPLKAAWRVAFDRKSTDPERRIYLFAFMGIILGIAILCGFSVKLGLKWWVAVLFFGIYFLLALTITRVRAELGTPHEINFVNPRTTLVTFLGSDTIGAANLTALSTMHWYNRGYRCHPMPNELEAIKMGDTASIRRRSTILVMIVAIVWGYAAVCWANMHITFDAGGRSKAAAFKYWVGAESYDKLSGWIQTPTKVNFTEEMYLFGGAAFTLFLRGMRGTFLWWPFHPAGYALATSYAMEYFWFCFLIAWIIKALIVRFGGMKAYRAAIPFFLGLVLGDYITGSLWALYGAISGVTVYRIFI